MGRLVLWFCWMGKGAGRTFMVTDLGGRKERKGEIEIENKHGEGSYKNNVDTSQDLFSPFSSRALGSISHLRSSGKETNRLLLDVGVVCAVTGSGLTQKLMVTTISCGTSGDRSLRAARWEEGEGKRSSCEKEHGQLCRDRMASSSPPALPTSCPNANKHQSL